MAFNGKELDMFLGIPFAEPPIGDLRFKKPVPLQNWPQEIEATKWSSPCMQLPLLTESMQNKNFSEDCLHLNIWSPINKSAKKSKLNKLKAVMVWFHGGANIIGSANEMFNNPSVLSAVGDVVVVSFNYRLTTFGFLYTGTDDSPGNMALWDQSLAMTWVKDHIKNFGGDPNQITIFGISAGSIDISAHIVSPISRNLFKNAIMMSGAAIGPAGAVDKEESIKYWVNGAKLIGCGDDQNSDENKFTPKMIECLKKSSTDKLASIPNLPQMNMGFVWYLPLIVVDGQFLTQKPLEMFKSGNFKKRMNLLIGTAEDEGSPLLALFVDPIKYNAMNPQNMSFNESYNELKRISTLLSTTKPVNGEEVAKLYFTGLSDSKSRDLLRQTIGIGFGDFAVTCPAIQFAKQLFKKDSKNSKVYQYYYNVKTRESNVICGKWMGVCHASDVSPVLGHPFAIPNSTDKNKEISKKMMTLFTTFAKTGKPSPQEGTEWPPYYTVNNIITTPYYEVTNDLKPRSNYANGLKINECEYLWKTYID